MPKGKKKVIQVKKCNNNNNNNQNFSVYNFHQNPSLHPGNIWNLPTKKPQTKS